MHLWSGGIKEISVLPGCCFLPKAGTLRMKGSSFKSCGFQKRTLQCQDADATLTSFTDVKAEMEKIFLGRRVEKSDVMSLRMPCCPRLAKEACVCTSPKALLVKGVDFQLYLRNVCLQGSLLCFGLLFSTELVKTNFHDIFVRILSQWTPLQAKFSDTSGTYQMHVFCKYVCV